jgi:hypothetical protein
MEDTLTNCVREREQRRQLEPVGLFGDAKDEIIFLDEAPAGQRS